MGTSIAIIIVFLSLSAACYLIGSCNFAILLTRAFSHTDVREHGSKNAGMTNVMRTAGKLPAVLTLLLDIAKGAGCVILGRFAAPAVLNMLAVSDNTVNPLFFAYAGGFFCLLGHIYPLYFGFRGGKGVASMLGIMLVIDWRVALIALSVFIVIFIITRIVSISSITAAVTLPFLSFFLYDQSVTYSYLLLGLSQQVAITALSTLFALILIFTHRENIKRLLHGEEKKFKLK